MATHDSENDPETSQRSQLSELGESMSGQMDVLQDMSSGQKIKVTGVNTDTCEEDLEDLFDNQCKAGKVDSVSIHRKTSSAIVIFSHPEDAEAMLSKQDILYEGAMLHITTPADEAAQPEQEFDRRTVQVEGVPEDYSLQKLQFLFSSPKRGGDIESLNRDEKTGFIVITFRDQKDAEKVVTTHTFRRENQTFMVNWYTPVEEEPCVTVRVGGLPDNIDREFFEDILATAGVVSDPDQEIKDVVFGENCAIVTCDSPAAAENLVNMGQISVDNMELTFEKFIEEVVPRKEVLVQNVPSHYKEEALKMFFQNKRKTNGGPVTSLTIDQESQTARIVFEKEEDARNIVEQKTFRRKDGVELHAVWFTSADGNAPEEEEYADPRSVEISGFTEAVDGEALEDFLENMTKECMKEIRFEKESRVVVVTFENQSGAEKVLSYKTLRFSNMVLNVKANSEKGAPVAAEKETASERTSQIKRFIEVTGISPTISEDFVRLFFENKDRSGGGEIEEMKYDGLNGRAFIRFRNESDAQRVHKKSIENQLILDDSNLRADIKFVAQIPEMNTCAIAVSGVPADYGDEYLIDLFENKRSGGGKVEDIYTDANRVSFVTFLSPADATRVLAIHKKEPIKMDETKLRIEALPCPVTTTSPQENEEPRRIFVTNIPEDCDKKDLMKFVESGETCRVTDVTYSRTPGEAVIDLLETPEGEDPWEHFRLRPLCGKMMTVQYVKKSRSVEVFGIKKLTMSKLQLYFESERRSNGGQIENITLFPEYDCAVVTFHEEHVVKRVLQKPDHETDKQSLSLRPHLSCLGILPESFDSTTPPKQIPDDIHISDINPKVLQYICKFKQEEIQAQLESVHAQVIWPVKGTVLTLKFMIPTDETHFTEVVKTWKATVEKRVFEISNSFASKQVDVPEYVLETFKTVDLKQRSTQHLEVTFSEEQHLIEITGVKEEVIRISEQCYKEITDEVSKLKRMAERTQDTVPMADWQLLFITQTGKLQEIQKKFDDFKITTGSRSITFEGTKTDVLIAKLQVLEISNGILKQEHQCEESVTHLLMNEANKEYVSNELAKRGMKVVIFTEEEGKLVVMSHDAETLKKAQKELHTIVVQKSIPISEQTRSLLRDQQWTYFTEELIRQFKNEIYITVPGTLSEVQLTVLERRDKDCTAKIEAYFDEHATIEEHIVADKGQIRLLQLQFGSVHRVEQQFNVQIHFVVDDNHSEIVINGPKPVMEKASDEVQRLLQSIIYKDCIVTQPGMAQYFSQSRGRNLLSSFESSYKVAIEPNCKDDTIVQPRLRSKSEEEAICNGVRIALTKRDITESASDGVFLSIQNSFKHEHPISVQLIEKGGQAVKRELQQLNMSSSRLIAGSALTTKAGQLKAKHLVHCVVPDWKTGDSEVGFFYEAVYQGLKEAATLGCVTVSIPVDFAPVIPLDAQITQILKATRDYSERFHKHTTVADIEICTKDSNAVKITKLMMCKEFVISKTAGIPHFTGEATVLKAGSSPNSLETLERITIELVEGEIANSKMEVVVNTTSSNMQLHTGPISRSILRKGGDKLQHECNEVLKQRGVAQAELGDVIASSGGNLHCKRVYHGALDRYVANNDAPCKILGNFIWNCLQQAHTEKKTSIAFPALGTGNLSFPKQYVADVILRLVAKFSKANTKTSIKRVEIVLYPKDTETIEAFMGVMATHRSKSTPDSSTMPKTRRVKIKSETKRQAARSVKSIAHKGIDIEVVQGDITDETTDVITYSTDKQLSFGSQIGIVLKKKAGDAFIEECKRAKMVGHVVITKAGNLPCKHVIHIDTPTNATEWKSRIAKCLKVAESHKLQSISFPALGTGVKNTSPALIATKMSEGVEEFSNGGCKYLKQIRIVIFESGMMEEFKSELSRIATSPEKQKKGWIHAMKDAVAGFFSFGESSDQNQSVEEDEDRELEDYEFEKGLTLRIFGFQNASHNIDGAKRKIEETCEMECQERRLESAQDGLDIAALSEEQIETIKRLERKYLVKISIERSSQRNMIAIFGRAENVSTAYVDINNILRLVDKHKEQQALFEKVKWQFEDDNGTFDNYPCDISWSIEQAYTNTHEVVQWTEDVNGKQQCFEINFNSMTEYNLDEATTCRKVKRHAPGSVQLPKEWSTMGADEKYKEVPLNKNCVEYEHVYTQFKNELQDNSAQYNRKLISVKEIKRIQNPSLYKRYMMHKYEVERTVPNDVVVERKLWHGTDAETINEINGNGFNRMFCGKNANVYGFGTYFSKYAGYSHGYAKQDGAGFHHMYLCSVLSGEFSQGSRGIRTAPPKDPNNPVIKFDSVVDSMDNPTMWIVFTDTQAYPEYLITYQA